MKTGLTPAKPVRSLAPSSDGSSWCLTLMGLKLDFRCSPRGGALDQGVVAVELLVLY